MRTGTVAILGAGQAGARAAETLRKSGSEARILLLGEETACPYERPPLSKEVLLGTPPAAIGGGAAHWRSLDVEFLPGLRIEAIERATRRLHPASGAPIGYDHLVIATGSRARHLPALTGAALPVLTLRTQADAAALREVLVPGRTLLLVGGGVIGLEVAASTAALGLRAVVVEAGPRLMGRCAPDVLGDRLLALHRARGVEVHLNAALERLEGRVALLSSGERVEADAVLLGVGARANDELAAAAGLDVADGILVDARGRTADPAIHAVGEVARHPLPRFGVTLRQESWRHAEQHPRAVMAAALDAAAGEYDEVPGFWSDQHGERLLVEGLPGRGGRTVLRDGARPVTFHLDADGVLVGAATLSDSRAMAVARRLIGARARPDAARLADPGTELRALLA